MLRASTLVLTTLVAGAAYADGDPERPVVRAAAGDWGMFFRFGGLASMTASNNTRDINNLLVTQVGLRYVVDESFIVPFSVGSGFRHLTASNTSQTATDVGFDINAGFEYHFRQWRRISPFVGLSLGLGLSEPEGDDNTTFGVGLGPSMGVEYYIADRVSLIAQYLLTFQLEIVPDRFTGISVNTLSGGALNLVFYF